MAQAKAKRKSTAKKKATTTRKATTKKDNRNNQRVPIQLLVDYRCDGNYLFDFCRDLGTGGVFIQTESPLPQGSNIDLTFTIPDSNETLSASGKVIWVQSKVTERKDLTSGMGVQFNEFDADQRKLLGEFIDRYSNLNSDPTADHSKNKSA